MSHRFVVDCDPTVDRIADQLAELGETRLPLYARVSDDAPYIEVGALTIAASDDDQAAAPAVPLDVTAYDCARRAAAAIAAAETAIGNVPRSLIPTPEIVAMRVGIAEAWRMLGERIATLDGMRKPETDDEHR